VSDTSPMDRSISTALIAVSDGDVSSDTGYAARLYVGCGPDGATPWVGIHVSDVLEDTGMSTVEVRVRFDSLQPVMADWPRAEDGQWAFADSASVLMQQMRSARRVLIELPVYGQGKRIASFAVSGLSNSLAALSCATPARVTSRT
jgi:hypothetical protein